MKKQIIKGVAELIEGATKSAPKAKTYKGRKRGRKSAAARKAKNEAAKASRAKLAANRGPQHRGQKLLKKENAKPKLTLGQKLKREKGKVDTSGLSKEESKERRSLIARVIREARAEGKGKKAPTGTRKQTLTKEGLKLVQKGDIETIVKNPKKYMYEGADAQLVSKDATSEFASRKEMREAFKEMSKGERMDFIQKNITPKMTSKQISDILGQGEGVPKLPKQQNIASTVRKLKRQGYPGSLTELRKNLKARPGMTKPSGGRKYKKGGRVRGCGAALRGYGKAMK
jgi:hypothetical protein